MDDHEARTRKAAPDERVLRFQSLQAGSLFADRYRIVERIGAGGAGEVYRVHDRIAEAEVALKVLYPGSGSSDLERLRRELRLVRELRDPGIVRTHDIGSADGFLFTVSELLDGESLRERLERSAPLPPAKAETILRGILSALAVAHAAGVIHRDVKPGNIFLARGTDGHDTRVVLLDFGLARDASTTGLTTVGRFLGTPEYSSPEQVRGDSGITPATDLYACGITLWEMLSGDPPFRDDSEMGVLNAHLSTAPPNPGRALRNAGPHLKNLVLQMLEKNPARRPATGGAALELLEKRGRLGWIASTVGRTLRRRRAWGSLAVAAALGVALGVVWSLGPVAVSHEQSTITWKTRIGIEHRRDLEGAGIAVAELEQPSFGLFTGTWVARMPPEAEQFDDGGKSAPSPLLHYLSTPFSEPVEPFAQAGGFYWLSVYPDVDRPFRPWAIYPLSHLRRPGEPEVALYSAQVPSYPAAITFWGGQTSGASFFHPGHLQKILPYRPANGGPLHVLALGHNNFAGPRPVLFSLPAGPQSFGQAPPYLAGTQVFPAGPGWYTFLPAVGHYHLKSLTLDDDRVVVELPPGPVMAFDIRTGVPLDEQYRGGLNVEQWEARQTELLRVLFEAAGFDQSDAHAEGAALLEEFAAAGPGSPQQLSVPLYRAALMRMRAGGLTGRDEYAAALADITAALEHERDPPRYRLLRAELFTRLQQRQQVAELIREWGRQPENPSYAFEWYLLDRLAGLPVRPERFLERWAGEMDGSGWGLAIRMLEAWLSGRYDEVERLLESFDVHEQTWAVHHYWAARAALDRQPAEPSRALDHLRRAAELPGVGLALPLATTRLRAELLLDTANGDARRLEPALKELDALLLSAASELSAFFMLPIAEREMAEVAATLGMPELARRFRERSASRAPSVVID